MEKDLNNKNQNNKQIINKYFLSVTDVEGTHRKTGVVSGWIEEGKITTVKTRPNERGCYKREPLTAGTLKRESIYK